MLHIRHTIGNASQNMFCAAYKAKRQPIAQFVTAVRDDRRFDMLHVYTDAANASLIAKSHTSLLEVVLIKKLAVFAGVTAATVSYWFAVIVAGQYIINSLYVCHSELREPLWTQCRDGQYNSGFLIFFIAQLAFTAAIWRSAPHFKVEKD